MNIIPLLLCLFQQSQATLAVSPSTPQSVSGSFGGPWTPAAASYALTNNSPQGVSYTASVDANWITLSSASGVVPPGNGRQLTATVDSDANGLAAGNYSATVTVTSGGSTKTRIINLSVTGTSLTPGTEWGGATAEPGQIGTGTAKCIARWDVVPYQTVWQDTFTVGVVAFHIAGIEKVSFGLEGGSFIDVTGMTLNPITNVWEYCATFARSAFAADEVIELRAIAYPNAAAPPANGTGAYPGGGYPRLLDSLFLYVDAGTLQTLVEKYCSINTGSDSTGTGTAALPYATPWKAAQAIATAGGGGSAAADAGIVYMDTGSYTWAQIGGGSVPGTDDRWLVFRPKPGVTRDQVHIAPGGTFPGMAIDRICLRDLTINSYIHGDNGGGGGNDSVWIDHCTLAGAGIGTGVHTFGGWCPGMEKVYWTDSECFDNSSSIQGGSELNRNIVCARNQYGIAFAKLVVNCTWDTMNNGGTSNHPDAFQWNYNSESGSNAIVYGCKFTNCQGAQGVFVKDVPYVSGVAIVNNIMETGNCSIEDTIDNWVIYNNTFPGTWNFDQTSDETNALLSFRGNVFGSFGLASSSTVTSTWFDQSHFVSSSLTPGTNVTTGSPGLDVNFAPVAGSPLLGRITPLLVPIDRNGVVRVAPTSVGAIQ